MGLIDDTRPAGHAPSGVPLAPRLAVVCLCLAVAGAAGLLLRPAPDEGPPATDRALDPIQPVPLPSSPQGGVLHERILQVSDARRLGERWVVADWRAVRLHLLDEEGRYLEGIGRDGDGPGEFRRPRAVATRGDSLIVVLDERRMSLEEFGAGGDFLSRRELELPGCLVPLPMGLEVAGDSLLVLLHCARMVPPGLDFAVYLIPPVGEPRAAYRERGLNLASRARPRFPVFAGAHPREGFWWAVSDRACLERRNASGELLETRCLDGWRPVHFPDSARRALEEGPAGGSPVRFTAPEHYPVMERLFSGSPHPLLLTVLGEEARALDRIDERGRIERMRSGLPPATFVDGSHLLAGREELEGVRIWVLPVEEDG